MRQLALPLTFSTRAFCWIRGAPSTTFACSEQVRARSGRNSRSSPSRSRTFSEFQLCGHSAPPFSTPRAACCSCCRQLAGSFSCSLRTRLEGRHRSQVDRGLMRTSAVELWTAHREKLQTRHTPMQGLFCSWCRIGQVMQATHPPNTLPCPLPRVLRSAMAGAASCVLRAVDGVVACCRRHGRIWMLCLPIHATVNVTHYPSHYLPSVRAEVGYDGRDKTQPPPTHLVPRRSSPSSILDRPRSPQPLTESGTSAVAHDSPALHFPSSVSGRGRNRRLPRHTRVTNENRALLDRRSTRKANAAGGGVGRGRAKKKAGLVRRISPIPHDRSHHK